MFDFAAVGIDIVSAHTCFLSLSPGGQLAENGTKLTPCDARALKDLCAGVTWMQRVPPAVLASYRALYVVLRGHAAAAEDEINRCVARVCCPHVSVMRRDGWRHDLWFCSDFVCV